MRRLRRTLAGAAVLATLPLVAGACDSSPYAASINGHVIKQTALNLELRQRSANKDYIASINADASQTGVRVGGTAEGNYSTAWTAEVLSDMVDASVVHQHLSAIGALPSAEELNVARAISAVSGQQNLSWYRFPAALRTTLAQRLADDAQLFPQYPITATQAQQLFTTYGSALFSRVCIRTADTTSAAQAANLVRTIDAGGGNGAGSVTCYDQAAFEELPLSQIQTVLRLADHRASSAPASGFGYTVTAVASRTLLPVDAAFRRVIAVAAGTSVGGQRVRALLAAANVKINPAYGSWSKGGTKALRVVPPTVGLGYS